MSFCPDKSILHTDGIRGFLLRWKREETLNWIDEVYHALPDLIERLGITSIVPNQRARYGMVLQCSSDVYGDIILKFAPAFINRFEREAEAYSILPKSYMCEEIEVDYKNRCIILRSIPNAGYACFEDRQKLNGFFGNAIRDAVRYTGQPLQHIEFYRKELKKRCDDTSTLRFHDREIKDELLFAWDLYNDIFRDADLYILHGDLIDYNILDDNKRYYGVDPIGFIAPIELECVRFIRNDVRDHAESGYRSRFELLISNFAELVDRTRLIRMFMIDMAYCTYNSVFENDTPNETEVDLELISIAKDLMG